MKIQDWFIDKNYNYVEAEFKSICGWFPKSVCRKEAFDD